MEGITTMITRRNIDIADNEKTDLIMEGITTLWGSRTSGDQYLRKLT